MPIEDEIILRNPDTSSDTGLWPRLSCSAPNQVTLAARQPLLDQTPTLFFQGTGQLKAAANLRVLTGEPATEKLVILSNGNVGIGESSPTARLSVNGALKLQQGVTVNEFSNDGNLADSSDLSIPTEKAVKAYVDTKITQVNTTLATKAAISGAATQDFQTRNLSVAGTVTASKFQGDGSGLTGLVGTTQWVNGDSGSIYYNNGNVGIGMASPTQKLHVVGNAHINNTFLGDVGHGDTWAGFSHIHSNSIVGYALLQRNDGLYTLINKRAGGGYLGFRVDNADKMIIDDGGNVGIGTTTPNAKLYVHTTTANGGNNTAAFYAPNIGPNASHIHWGTTGDWYIRSAKSDGAVFLQDTGGSILVGGWNWWFPTETKANLNVNGDIWFSGNLIGGGKGGYVMDQFVNKLEEDLEEGDVVVVAGNQASLYYGPNNNIPIPEVDTTQEAYDTRVCGIVCEVYATLDPNVSSEASAEPPAFKALTREEISQQNRTVIQPDQTGWMVTLGTYAHCKVDADIAPIQIGDLLTTSPTKGHAQKVLDRLQATGAIVGKALGSLEKGKGKIPVLVMLQ